MGETWSPDERAIRRDLAACYRLVALGRKVREAFRSIANIETACSVQVAALSMGRPLHFQDPWWHPKQIAGQPER